MSADARAWFPPGLLELASVRNALAERIDGWSSRWFAQGQVRLHRIRLADAAVRTRADEGHSLDRGGMRLGATTRGGDLLTALALDLPESGMQPTPDDRHVLTPFLEQLLEDLLGSLQETASAAPFGDGAATIELSDGGGRLLCWIHLDSASLAALIKAAMPPQRSATTRLAPRAAALAQTKVGLELRVGSALVPIHALRALGPGDIVVLDRATAAGPDIAFPRAPRGFAHVALTAGGNTTEIHFTQAIG